MHARFAGSPDAPSARDFSHLLTGWLDPHGLWSAAPDAPLGRELRERAGALLEELRRPPESKAPCSTAESLGGVLAQWVSELGSVYDRAAERARPVSRERALALAMASAFQDDPVTEPARVLSRKLGEGVSQFAKAFPETGAAVERTSRARYFPQLSAREWGEVLLAAAVRAYVPLVDPHGDWAPFEEEWSLYADDPGLDGDPRLWREITRTAVGVRIVDGPTPPLETGELVLSVEGTLTAGMPLEQAEQLARLEPHDGNLRRVQVLRSGHDEAEELAIDFGSAPDPGEEGAPLEHESVRFGEGSALVVRIPDVPDGLGDSLGRLIAEARAKEPIGVLLDLRGNGGGSTDAAASVVGLFLPGAPLFPLSSHGKVVEIMRALEPAKEQRFAGPLAVLVDGYTASAAEMIAGALSAYGRAPVIGSRTFGKGCIQEYADDHAGRGVLRVTTLLFSLPNGSPVQRTGLAPDVLLSSPLVRERESDMPRALPSYSGPDVRESAFKVSRPWPSHRGHVGPCRDAAVCRALWRLGASEVAQRTPASRRLTAARLAAGSRP
jgi:carboxyl-terminal processing protease